ncbi:MAG: helix-turn-helix domain-containing protein [Syntrophobacterales bacterium]|nr:helix-turn-helix domain-containing protein [Syntrophobacterales bacterium]
MSSPSSLDSKSKAIGEQGTLNPRPEDVKDPLFQGNEFFDPRDLMQVKYEMLRRYQTDGTSATLAAQAFGFSRVTFYQVLKRFKEDGIGGLFPKLRGPKSAHKLSEELIGFVETAMAEDPALRPTGLAELIKGRFDISVHPRSIERSLARRQKKQSG